MWLHPFAQAGSVLERKKIGRKVRPHEHLRPAGVCAGIAMAGNLFLLLALTKRTIIRQIIILWEKNAMFAGFFEAKLTRFLPEAKGFSLATVHARLAPERLS